VSVRLSVRHTRVPIDHEATNDVR